MPTWAWYAIALAVAAGLGLIVWAVSRGSASAVTETASNAAATVASAVKGVADLPLSKAEALVNAADRARHPDGGVDMDFTASEA